MIHSPAKSNLLTPPKLVRNGGHYFPGVPSEGREVDLSGASHYRRRSPANSFDQMIRQRPIGGEEERNPRWQNEFLLMESCTETVRLLKEGSLFSKGIVEFRAYTIQWLLYSVTRVFCPQCE